MTSTAGFTNSPIPEVLNRYNFETWRSLMETYLMAEDLWEVIDQKWDPETGEDFDDDGSDNADWKRKNAKALHAIQKSCGLEMLKFVSGTKMAKLAWEILEHVSIRIAAAENKEHYEQCRRFTDLVSKGEWDKAKESLKSKELDIQSVIRASARFEGYSAIHVAASKGHVNILKDLIEIMSYEDLKKKDSDGNTPLHVAVINGKLYTVKLLVFYMGETVNNDGDTALHVAVTSGEVEILKELVSNMRNTDMRMRNNYGNTALHIAVSTGNIDMIRELAPLMRDVRGPNGDTAVHVAVKLGARKEIVRELLSRPSWMHEEIYNDELYTALHLAVNKAHVPIVKQFMPSKREHEFGSNCIQFATYVERGEWDNAKGCLTEQDDLCDAITAVDPRCGNGNTALHLAAAAGHVHIVKEMISLLKGRERNLKLKDPEFEHRIDPKAFQIPSSMSVAVNEDLALNNPEYLGHYPIPTGINLVAMKDHVLKNAEYMIEQYDQKLSSILEVQNTEGETVLHLAAWYGNVDMVKELVPLMTTEGLEIQDDRGCTPLHYAVFKGDRDIVRELLLIMRPTGLEIKATEHGQNALHLAIMVKNMDIAKEVMRNMRKEALEDKDSDGYTALAYAITEFKEEEVMGIVKNMAEINPKVFGNPVPPRNWIPAVNVYTLLKKWDFCRYLYRLTPLEYLIPENGSHGSWLIIKWLRAKKFDLVLDLLGRCSKIDIFLRSTEGEEGWPPIVELARMSSEFPSATHLGFRRRLIYNRLCTDLADDNALHINITQDNEQDNQTDLIPSGVSESPEMKRTGSIDIIRRIGEMLKEKPPTPAQLDVLRTSLIEAVKHGNVEFVSHICEACPSLAYSRDENNKHIFHVAVESRQHKIYNLLYRIDEEERNQIFEMNYPENMLHLAAKISPLLRFNRIYIRRAALQLQRELQWFKEVESIMEPEMREIRNSDGLTPRELFTKTHEILKKEAEDSMKGTASSCTVVGALIVTMMFAAAFTFPGGNNGNTGYPMFLSKDLFFVFIVSDTIALVSSTTSVITFLGIFTSRYAEDDFLKDLPTKLMIGLSTLFISIVTMMIAFSSALIIMLHKQYPWAITPTILATSVPVVSYIWFQFPLLFEIFRLTYGPQLFDKKLKKGKPWIKRESSSNVF